MRLNIDLRPGRMEDRFTGSIVIGGANGERTIRMNEARATAVVAAFESLKDLAEPLLDGEERALLRLLAATDDEHEHELGEPVDPVP